VTQAICDAVTVPDDLDWLQAQRTAQWSEDGLAVHNAPRRSRQP
jgi:hypothetical protein